VLYPRAGFTKGEVIDYYTRIAPVLLPHLEDRALTRIRYPNGVDAQGFFEKNKPGGTPDWVRVERLPAPGSTKDREMIDYVVVDGLPTLVWLANLAALELHTPQWKVGSAGPDMLVVDLDPGRRPGSGSATRSRCGCGSGWPRTGSTRTRRRPARRGCSWPARSPGSSRPTRSAGTPTGSPRSWRRPSPADPVADGEEPAARQGVHRLEPEQRGQDDGHAVLAAGTADADRVHPADLGRGRAGDVLPVDLTAPVVLETGRRARRPARRPAASGVPGCRPGNLRPCPRTGTLVRTLLIDNYDSYTYNLYQLISVTYGVEPIVIHNDDPAWLDVSLSDFDAVVISPGRAARTSTGMSAGAGTR
jgi:hypothetical protein